MGIILNFILVKKNQIYQATSQDEILRILLKQSLTKFPKIKLSWKIPWYEKKVIMFAFKKSWNSLTFFPHSILLRIKSQ